MKNFEPRSEDKKMEAPKFRTRDWLPWTIGSTIGFTLRTNFIAEVTKEAGAFTCLYLSIGAIIFSGSFFIIQSIRNKSRYNGSCRVDLNLIKYGKI